MYSNSIFPITDLPRGLEMKFFSLVNDVEYISTRIFQLAFLSSDMISTYDLKNTTISVYVFEEFDPKKK